MTAQPGITRGGPARLRLNLGADYMRRAGPVSRAGSVCRDLGTSVKHIENQLCDYMEKSQPSLLGFVVSQAGELLKQ